MPSLHSVWSRLPESLRRALADSIGPTLLPEGELAPEWALQSWDDSWHRVNPGRWALLVFYPGDGTPGCTRQLDELQAHAARLGALGVDLYAIDPADAASHKAFAQAQGYSFPLLTDRGSAVARRFRATLPPFGKVLRTVYLVNPERKIRLANRGAPAVAAIVRSVEALQQATRGKM